MKILVTGATGLIGSALCKELFLQKHQLVIITRNIERAKKKLQLPIQYYKWQAESIPEEALAGVKGVIHLSGENIAQKRWSQKQKNIIYNSRVTSTKNLVQALNQRKESLDFFFSASAIGYYSINSGQNLTENSSRGNSFLAKVCDSWEKEAQKIKAKRIVIFRLGMVLSSLGGVLGKLLPIFKLGLGGPIGRGNRQLSWIHLQDVLRFLTLAINDERYQGIVNLVAPQLVTNLTFTKILAKSLNRFAVFPVPPLLLKILLGEMSCLMLGEQKVIPDKLNRLNYHFLYPKIETALLACSKNG